MNKLNIKIKLLTNILNSGVSISEIEKIKDEYNVLDECIYIDYLINPKKIPILNKNRTKILSFIDKNQNLIDKLHKNDILYEILSGYDIRYHWDMYKLIIKDVMKVGKERFDFIVNILKKEGFSRITFTNEDFDKRFYEKVKKKFNEDKYEIDYYFSDGEKEYLPYYYSDSFPIRFKNAKIILNYKEGNIVSNDNQVILNTFDFDIEKIVFLNNEKKILNTVPFDEIKKFTKMCNYVRSLEKVVTQLSYSINSLEQLLEIKDIKVVTKNDLNYLQNQKKEYEILIKNTLNEYYKNGYDKERINFGLEYLKDAEWQASLDLD